jgi:hypothetical protein
LEINEETKNYGKVEVIILEESTLFLININVDKEKQTNMLEPPMTTNDKQVEEVKMLSETKQKKPLLDLDKCSLYELINNLKKFSNDPSINVHQARFGFYIENM